MLFVGVRAAATDIIILCDLSVCLSNGPVKPKLDIIMFMCMCPCVRIPAQFTEDAG